MSCNCNKPKCKCGISPSVLQINNPGDCTLFHRVEVPASMGDSKTNPPKNGDYRNVLLYYVADGTSWFFSSDGIPQKLVNGFTNYEDAQHLPSINNHVLLGNMTGSDLGLQNALVAGANIQIDGNTISATDTIYTLPIASANTLGGVKIGANLSIDDVGVLSADAQPAILYNSTGQNTDGAMTQKAATDSLAAKQDTLTAGDGIDITNNVISVATITNNEIDAIVA